MTAEAIADGPPTSERMNRDIRELSVISDCASVRRIIKSKDSEQLKYLPDALKKLVNSQVAISKDQGYSRHRERALATLLSKIALDPQLKNQDLVEEIEKFILS